MKSSMTENSENQGQVAVVRSEPAGHGPRVEGEAPSTGTEPSQEADSYREDSAKLIRVCSTLPSPKTRPLHL